MKERRDEYAKIEPCFDLLYHDPRAKIATAEEIIDSMDQDSIDRSVVLNIGWSSPGLCHETNDYILEAISRYPERLIGFCAIQPLALDEAVEELLRCIRGGVKGIGELRSDVQGFDLADKTVMSDIAQVAVEHGLIILTHASEPVGHSYSGKGTITPDILYRFIQEFPDLRLVCAHWGGGLPFYALMPEVARALTNVYFDTAASPFLYHDRIFKHAIEIIGGDRILFGSDYPLIKQDRIIKSINSLNLQPDIKNKILGGNAQRLLALT